MLLTNKVIVITGAFGSLGRAVAKAVAAQGARLAQVDHAPAAAGEAADGVLSIGAVDLTDADAAVTALNTVSQQFGGIDALVNIAGGFRYETLESGSLDTWDLMYRLNVRTAVAASKAALPHLLKRGAGRIVNVGAMAASRAAAGMGAYTASKAGIARFTEALSEELKDRHVTVNAVLPSIIDTQPNRADMPKADFERWVKPEDLANVIVFLLSPQASAVTGALIPVANRV